MKFQITTDYAIRIMVDLANHDAQIFTAKEIAERLGITYNYFNRIVTTMKQAGFIESVQGDDDSYRLAKNAVNLSLYDIIEAMEGSIRINRCLEEGSHCSMHGPLSSSCGVRRFFESVQTDIINVLKKKKIYELCR